MQPLVLLSVPGLTPRFLEHAPRLKAVADAGWVTDMTEVLPVVSSTAQATILTGKMPDEHGIVANGWLHRSTNEIRFWHQSNRLVQTEPVYETARYRAKEKYRPFKTAKLFWGFAQGAAVDIAVAPKLHQALSGDRVFGLAGRPQSVPEEMERKLGPFPFAAHWGPAAGKRSTEWIAAAAALVLRDHRTDFTLVALPHLDFDPQRFGPAGCDMPRRVKELDDAAAPLLDAAREVGARVWVVSEYGYRDVSRPVHPNRVLRAAGFLEVRPGPFGEQLDVSGSRAVAVCDHQFAHVYVPNPDDVLYVRDTLSAVPGVARVACGEQRVELRLKHSRAGDVVLLAEPDSWFAYPFWKDDALAPDYARAVAGHVKPGSDPCELFLDQKLWFPKWRAATRSVPLDAALVRGSHGLAADHPADAPLLIGHGPNPGRGVPMTAVRDLLLGALELA